MLSFGNARSYWSPGNDKPWGVLVARHATLDGFAAAYTRNYFAVVCLILLANAVFAFSDNLFTDIHQPSNSDPVRLVHGLFALAWMIMLALQPILIRQRRFALHRQIGPWAFVIGAGLIVTTIVLFAHVWRPWDEMSAFVRANRLALAAFTLALGLSYAWRTRGYWHKRLVLVGTLLMLEPMLSRTLDPFVYDPLSHWPEDEIEPVFWLVEGIVWHLFFISLLLYDWLLLRRLHAASIAGLATFYAIWTIAWFS